MGEPEPAPDEPVVGLSGARFPTARQRAKLDGEDETESGLGRNGKKRRRHDRDRVGRSGARFPSASVLEKYAEPEPEPEPPPPPPPPPPPLPEPEPEQVWLPADDGLRVRPYVLTGGRTRSRRKLAIETLIAADPGGRRGFTTPESERLLSICLQPRSVAEIAAQLSVPLGVAQVLIGDLADAGRVTVHATATADNGRPDLALMHRVLDGLRRL
ncbi:DUF742 domain-containing protein [Amycolatopsis sp. 195334CR]|uniref:DUF742 domain-containing protein n=1 Tax=Amycolatopsis sp. 195334CR TaxID=2814588 RepID=UPI001A8E1822|nr:DUF742 domain-containing protein [Amycolatopsis sp. 195334CR]MBN6039227.1 DUF742 domain-containing protein [Amycolatopsis sp. 195334CR]